MTVSLSCTPVLGIDVGATKIAAGVVDPSTGDIRFLTRIPTRRHVTPDEIVSDISDVVTQVLTDARRDANGPEDMPQTAGIAVPELVDRQGQIRSTWNFALPGLAGIIRERTGVSVRLESDVRAAAFAEARFGSGQSCDSFAYFSLGSGISYTLCLKGRPYKGTHGFAIHFASSALAVPTQDRGRLSVAIPEDFASGLGMERLWAARGGESLKEGGHTLETLASAGNTLARSVIEDAADMTGRLIAQTINMLDPEKIVLGGGLGCSEGLYRQKLEEHVRANIWERSCADIPILIAGLGEQSGIIGAALSALAAD
ncbi:ROK family protein [Gluconobacter kanchanaburiensis]|uniref:Glucokinase n=1 Tax=Gluconobacter kanchanaburiensis NBRC 103587 TaxID=1307948 RepID=A0A511BHI1_9PROT|nr:ROK family protein [Gluconobacter kanchanaburiensis]MBF0862931.1 ROK family protein [Gluconobacter kanchanaburiensis]GBR69132.1 glucokinase [Gluconobacter kanchanaburiensis NBRC 103587]GEK97257.1 glucokinase [Gluconobacter kanchanaburiensis NBRC 103587]